MSDVAAISAAGLVLDIGGGLTLASAFMLKRPRETIAESASYFGSNPYLLPSIARQTADAWMGGALLSLGFSLQLLQALGFDPDWATLQVTIPVAFELVLWAAGVLLALLRPWNVRRTVRLELEQNLEHLREPDSFKYWLDQIVAGCRKLGRPIRPGERPADVAIMVLGKEGWDRLTAGLELPADLYEPYQPPAAG